MGSALLGVMAMQLYFLVQAYNLQSQLFDGLVNDALNNVVSNIAKRDANNFLKEKTRYINAQNNPVGALYKDSATGKARHFVNRKVFVRDSLKRVLKRLAGELADSGQVGSFTIRMGIETYTDENGVTRQNRVNEIVNSLSSFPNPDKLHRYDTARIDYIDPQFGHQVVTRVRENPIWRAAVEHRQELKQYHTIKKALEQDSLDQVKTGIIGAVYDNIAEEYQKSAEPLKNRIDPLLIDTLLRLELHNKGIYLPFSYEVSTANNDSLIFSKASDVTGERPVFTAANKPYQTAIFAKNVFHDPGMLRLMFPAKNTLILGNMGFSMGTSGGLLLILIFCFGYTIFSILRQKKISEMKTDFINNMTHEFKTPVSTIMIASEALKDDEVTADKSRITRLANIIYEENARLGSHIERVLNIARIEKDDFKLDIKPVGVNELIKDVLGSMALKLQKYNAQTVLNLDAAHATINADELHFSNVIYNLVDNAIKYSNDAPQITITTSTVRNTLVITVADKGIGMTRDQQARIFEQFYRIPTGNLHDVKGFGLGLSYVNTIVKRLDGTISVKSEKDKGSEFEMRFPVV